MSIPTFTLASYDPHYGAQHPPDLLPIGYQDDRGLVCAAPDEKGGTSWVRYLPAQTIGPQNQRLPRHVLPHEDPKSVQRLWLQAIRARLGWPESLSLAGCVSRRTWEGWELGKRIPYFRLAITLRSIWDRSPLESQRGPAIASLSHAQKKRNAAILGLSDLATHR